MDYRQLLSMRCAWALVTVTSPPQPAATSSPLMFSPTVALESNTATTVLPLLVPPAFASPTAKPTTVLPVALPFASATPSMANRWLPLALPSSVAEARLGR